ncbi:MAG: transposase [Desulfitobacteriaceae bacterium]|nr:transposase [Desulfitobacteriaceae bacterium]
MGVKKHSDEFKKQVVKEALETGNSSLVGRKYNINPSIVARWVRAEKPNPMKSMTNKALQNSPGLSEDPREAKKAIVQNTQLKKLLGEKELEIEILRDLLKKMKIPLPPR